MIITSSKIAFGGGCHWCTEAVFQNLMGVEIVDQGFVAATGENSEFSEAVIVHFNPEVISLHRLVEIHLNTHHSTSNHSMRSKYRSAIYGFNREQEELAIKILQNLQSAFKDQIVTKVLTFKTFRSSIEDFIDYYKKGPERPFCKTYIVPKLQLLKEQFSEDVKTV